MRIGLLTGGGDAPGLNSVIESVSRTLLQDQHELIGICDGFEGVFEQRIYPLSLSSVDGLHALAGTLLGTSNRCGIQGREAEFLAQYKKLKLDGLVVAGGDGTFGGLKPFRHEIPLIGIPKTIDNDISGTDVSFGFDTACGVVADAVDALRATAHAHRRVFVVEAMGRTAGWIALGAGLASYSDGVLIPERPFLRSDLLQFIQRKQKLQRGLLLTVAEGAMARGEASQIAFHAETSPQKERYGGVAELLARFIEAETGWESRHVVLGHLQRSHHPTTTDRLLTLSMGVEVSTLVKERAWNQAVVYRQGRVARAPIDDVMGPPRLVDPNHRWVQMAQALGMFI